jgi:hypothetical protein
MLPILLNFLTAIASLSTMAGIFVHDTTIDRFATMALSMPTSATTDYESSNRIANFGGELHAHTEQISIVRLVGDNPRVQPRNDEKKHLLQKRVMRGHHPFDNYNLPIV